jgi:hypothetical protein
VAITKPQHPERVAIVTIVLAVVASVAIWGAMSQVDGPAAVQRPVAIVDLFPDEGQIVLPQDIVGAQVRTNFQAELTINGHPIPRDQLTGDQNLGQYLFDAGPGKEFSALPEGPASAVIEWWPRDIPTAEEAKDEGKLASYTWNFKVG